MSVPPGTEMFQFPGFASYHYEFMIRYPSLGGLPHSDIHGSTPARGSPWLFAACHVLHRLLVPRHPPNALLVLDTLPRARAQGPPCTETSLRPPQRPGSVSAHASLRTLRTSRRACITRSRRISSPGDSSRHPPLHRSGRIVHTPLNPRRRPLGRHPRRQRSRSDIRPHDGPLSGVSGQGSGIRLLV